MANFSRRIISALLALTTFAPLLAQEGVVVQPQFGKQIIEVPAEGELLYYDPKGTSDMGNTSRNNTQSLVVFKPQDEGMAVRIEFSEFDVCNENKDWGDYPGEVRIYNGEADAGSTFTWATTISEVAQAMTLPDGDVIAVLDGEYGPLSYYSTSPDGILSVGMLWVYARKCKGWTARVSCVAREDMKVVGAGSVYSNVTPSPKRKKNVALASFYVDTQGFMNPDTVRGVSFELTANEGMVVPENIRVLKGTDNVEGASPIGATVTGSGSKYSIALNQELALGRNGFTLAADILPDAPVGAKVRLDVQNVSTVGSPDGVVPFNAGLPVDVVNPAIVLLSKEHQDVNVGNTPLTLYDDGGPDGDITPEFSGTVTFYPTEPGKKVQVDFTKVDLSRGTIYYQYINVYDGAEWKYRKPVMTLRNGETAVVHSSAENGAITVELTNNGTSQTASGIEATVSLFEPTGMVVDNIMVTQPEETATVCAGDVKRCVLKVNVGTRNTDPALSLSSMKFDTNGTSANITHAELFYTHADNEFKATNYYKVAECDVDGNGFVMQTEGVELSEYDNIFWLALDISPDARQDAKVDPSLVSVSFGNNEILAENGNPNGYVRVDNVAYMYENQGTVTRAVGQPIVFKTRDFADTHSYEPGNDERITVFTPAHEGGLCQIDFTEFALQYVEGYVGGVKAKFAVYSGIGTSGSLLWELNSEEQRDKGPGRLLRSEAADGALTIVFCPRDSYYRAEGFTANVSVYYPHDMAVDTIVVEQASSKLVMRHATNEPLLNVDIVTSGNLTTLEANGIRVNMKNTHTNVERLMLYHHGESGETSLVSSYATNAADGEFEMRFEKPVTLSEGANHFSLHFDVGDDAGVGAVVDAMVKSVKIGDTNVAVAYGDPDGVRMVSNVVLLSQGDNGIVPVPDGETVFFYDDGGPDENATAPFEGLVTFVPQTDGKVARFDFKEMTLYPDHYIYVYDGIGADESKLIARLTYLSDIPERLYSHDTTGALTFKYVAGSGYPQSPGFAVDVTSYTVRELEVGTLAGVSVAQGSAMRGECDVPLVRLDVALYGDEKALTLEKLNVVVDDDAALQAVRVYSTGKDAVFAPIQLVGSANDQGVVDACYDMQTAGTYHFWITADIDSGADVGEMVALHVAGLQIDGQEMAVESQTGNVAVAKGVSGQYTVGDGGDFTSIQEAVDAVAGGIDGPVVISILPGVYEERVEIPEIKGSSPLNTITLRGSTGNCSDVVIRHDNYDEPPYTEDKMFREYGVFTFNGADYVTLKNIQLTTDDLRYPSVVHVKNASRHVTIDSCHIYAMRSETMQLDINLIYTYAKNEPWQNNDYLTVSNCHLDGGWIGARLTGTGYVALPKQVGGVIKGNSFTDQGSKAIYVMDELGATVKGNTIVNTTSERSNFTGIDTQLRDDYHVPYVIEDNIFRLSTLATSYAMYLRQLQAPDSVPVRIANNEVNFTNSDPTSAAVLMCYPARNVLFAHNTVKASGTAAQSLWIDTSLNGNVTLANNIIQNETNGPAMRVDDKETLDKIDMRGCNLYANSGKAAVVGDTWYDMSHWENAINAQNCFYKKVEFLDKWMLEPAELGNLNKTSQVEGIDKDLTGMPRSSTPTIGAYEWCDYDKAPHAYDDFVEVKNITAHSADIMVTPSQSGTMWAVVLRAGEAQPDAEAVMARGAKENVMRNKNSMVTVDGLAAGHSYVAYVVLKNLKGGVSDLIASMPFSIGQDGDGIAHFEADGGRQKEKLFTVDGKPAVGNSRGVTIVKTANTKANKVLRRW